MLPKLYYITQPTDGLTYASQIEKVCRGGVRLVQLRLKDTSKDEILKIAYEVKQITDAYNAYLIINDSPEIAVEVKAHGVHLGMNDMHPKLARQIVGNDKFIGGTANTIKRVVELHEYVDYFGIGPFRFTNTKKNLAPVLGIEGYMSILKSMKELNIQKPVFAIGGIEEYDIVTLMHTGIFGVAVSSAISKSSDMMQAGQKLLALTG